MNYTRLTVFEMKRVRLHCYKTMKKQIIFLLLLALSVAGVAQEKKIKVACIGNSITYGAGIKDRKNDSYPVVLGKLLGEGYEVRNFGISGRTLLNKGDRPYMKEQIYQDALDYQPDVVVIKLGTNDTKPQNWVYGKEYPEDMQQMIKTLRKLPSHPRILLCYPAKAYRDDWGINDSIIVNGVIPGIDRIARKNKLKVVDLHTLTDGMIQNFPDRIHPNEEGAKVIAEAVYRAISSCLD